MDKNSDVFKPFPTSTADTGLELFSVNVQPPKCNRGQPPQPCPDVQFKFRVPKPDFHEFKQGYRFDPSKIDWENMKKSSITADTLKKHEGLRPGNAWLQVPQCLHCILRGTVGGFYLKPTDVKLSFYRAKDGTVVPKLHGVQQDEKLLQRPFHEHGFTKQEQGNLQGTGNLGGIAEIKDLKSGEQIPCSSAGTGTTHELEYMRADKWKCPDTICNVQVSLNRKPP